MWDIDNRTPFPAHARFDRDSEGCTWFCIFFKLTVEIRPGSENCRTAARQYPFFFEPRYGGAPATTALLSDTDMCLVKNGTDILLHGRIPGPQPGSSPRRVGLEVGSMRKVAEVHPALAWDQDLRPKPVQGEPLVDLGWTSGYGGTCPVCTPDDPQACFDENPIGMGYASKVEGARHRRLPRLVVPGGMPVSWDSRAIPVGFGPVPGTWPSRKQYVGTYDAAWAATKAPFLPDDFDEAFFRVAPPDQQMPTHLQGGEPITLHGIPIGEDGPAQARFSVPQLALEVHTRFRRALQPLPMALSTLHLFPEAGMMTLLWQGRLRVGASQRDVDVGDTRIALRGARQLIIHPDHVGEL